MASLDHDSSSEKKASESRHPVADLRTVPGEEEKENGFKTFDRSGMPEPKRLKDPSMRGRMKRSKANRRRKKRRRMIIQGVSASVIAIIILTLVVLTARNYALRSAEAAAANEPKKAAEPAPAEPAEPVEPVGEKSSAPAPRAEVPAVVGNRERRGGGKIEDARDRFLSRGAYDERSSGTEDRGVPGSSISTTPRAGEEISDEERKNLLEKAMPYSDKNREKQKARPVSPDDLYVPLPGGGQQTP